jgi:hypothetical protein
MAETHEAYPERRDVDGRALVYFAGGLVAFLVAVAVLLRLVFGYVPASPPFGAGLVAPGRTAPALLTDPHAERRAYEAEKDSELNSFGWVDRQAGIAHIPIAEAMKLLAAHGGRSDTGGPSEAGGQSQAAGAPGQPEAAPANAECALLTENVPRTPQAAACRNGVEARGSGQ